MPRYGNDTEVCRLNDLRRMMKTQYLLGPFPLAIRSPVQVKRISPDKIKNTKKDSKQCAHPSYMAVTTVHGYMTFYGWYVFEYTYMSTPWEWCSQYHPPFCTTIKPPKCFNEQNNCSIRFLEVWDLLFPPSQNVYKLFKWVVLNLIPSFHRPSASSLSSTSLMMSSIHDNVDREQHQTAIN